jgi:hypothetical protein
MRVRAVVALVLALAVVLGACGRQGGEQEVRETLATFADATARKDYQRLCDELFSRELVEQVNRTYPCELALKNSSLADARSPKLEVRSVKLDGDTASAVVRSSAANQPASEDTVRLVREGDRWRIASLASSSGRRPSRPSRRAARRASSGARG